MNWAFVVVQEGSLLDQSKVERDAIIACPGEVLRRAILDHGREAIVSNVTLRRRYYERVFWIHSGIVVELSDFCVER